MKKLIIAGLALLMLIPSAALAQHRPGGGGGGWHRSGGGGWSSGWRRPGGGGGWYGPRYHDGGNAIGGAIIGGMIGSWLFPRQPEVVVVPQEPMRDVTWCQQRFRSYDVYTRTYLGYDGLRHGCP